VASAISALQERGFYPEVYIYDPWHILRNTRKKLIASEDWQTELMRSFKTVIYSRSAFEYERPIRILA
jgi:hypothetical protein